MTEQLAELPLPASVQLVALKLPLPLELKLIVPVGVLVPLSVSVTVAVQVVGLPAVTVDGAQLTLVEVGRFVVPTVRRAVWVTSRSCAMMVAVVIEPTPAVVKLKRALVWPSATVIREGRSAIRKGRVVPSSTIVPPGGAGALRVTVPPLVLSAGTVSASSVSTVRLIAGSDAVRFMSTVRTCAVPVQPMLAMSLQPSLSKSAVTLRTWLFGQRTILRPCHS